MNDLISRQAAISLAGDLQIHGDEYHMYNQAINNYCAEIMGLPPTQSETHEERTGTHACVLMPSAQPERKKGKWIDAVLPNDSGGLQVQVCDQCNTFFPLAYTGGGHNFCPNCGAEMRGDDDA